MNPSSMLLMFQDDSTVWIIIIAVVVILFFVIAVVVIGLVIFFVMRKRKKAQALAVSPELEMASALPAEPVAPYAEPVAPYAEPVAPYSEPYAAYPEASPVAEPEAAAPVEEPLPEFEAPAPIEEIKADVPEAAPAPLPDSGSLDFDPSRTVAITRENTVAISYGHIKFVSGVLAGEQFQVEPEGAYIGREPSLAQIVVSDPRISKRHLWIGVKDGLVRIVDQDSRNGTFVNDPKSERVTEATLNAGDTVILGESDVARFEYQM